MKFNHLLATVFALTFVVGCKTVDIKDGRVPTQYLSQAKKLEGVYRGEFNGVSGDLIIRFEGNKPVVTYRNSHGTDLLNNDCDSSIGNLLKVTVKNENKNPRVSSALFRFNPGNCSLMVLGRDVSLTFKETDRGMKVGLSVLAEFSRREECNFVPGNPPYVPPSQHCQWRQEPVYLFGRFIR